MRVVTFQVLGIAQPKGSTRAFLPKGSTRPIVTADNPAGREWQRRIALVAQSLGEAPFTGPVAVALVFRMPRPKSKPRRIVHCVTRPDLDKLCRQLDALTGVLFADDAQIVELRARKVYAADGTAPGADITIAEAAPPALEQSSFDLFREEALT